ncbi:MAG: hypothetical protein HY000_08345 [Planctomycetes bacterium]|nr:hypothetical protein [Planctomycetota bacterium]
MKQRYRSVLVRIVAAAAALAPLIACVPVYGHRRWTSQLEELVFASGWRAPEYPWDTSQGDGYWARLRRRPRVLQHLSQAPSDSDDVVSLHGLSLTLAHGQYTASADDPVWLVLRSTLSHDSQGLPGSGPQDAPASWKLREAALHGAPDDLLLRADKSTLDFTGINSGFPFELRPSSVSTSTARIIPYPDPANAPAGDLWQALWEATAVLYEHATITVGRPGWFRSGAGQWLMIPPLLSVRFDSDESVAAYADALRKLSENAPQKYLESAFDERAKCAWKQMGMDSQAAGYLAQDEAGRAAWIVGWYCTLHQRVPALLAGEASGEDAAPWIVLADAVSQVLMESVRSPLAYDQLEAGRGNNADVAQNILASATSPPEFVKPLRTIVSRPGSAAPRSLRPISPYLLPALYLDNVARGSLGIAALSCAAGLVGWWNLRRQARATAALTLAPPESGRAKLVAVAAVLLVASATTVLEGCNGLGQLNNFVYSVAGVLWLCSLIAAAGWLWVAELVRPQDQPEQDYQRRMAWLVGCAVVFAALLFLAKAGQGPRGRSDFYTEIMFWAANPSRYPLPWPVAWSVGLIAGASFVGFGVLRWRRWRRDKRSEPGV